MQTVSTVTAGNNLNGPLGLAIAPNGNILTVNASATGVHALHNHLACILSMTETIRSTCCTSLVGR
jgi:hypothetical protein